MKKVKTKASNPVSFEVGERVRVKDMGTGQDEFGVVVSDLGVDPRSGEHYLVIDFYPRLHEVSPFEVPGKRSEYAINIKQVLALPKLVPAGK